MTYRLLIIDDHPETLDIISRVLKQQGYAVIAVDSAVQGLTLASTERPDLILLDGMMPEMDGWEVCRRIRANKEISSTPIIMFSAVNEAEQKLAGFEAGADDYLTKPTEPVELAERVKALLEGMQPRHEISVEPIAAGEKIATSKKETVIHPTAALSSDKKLIAVLGVRGGVGTTILSLNLAYCLSQTERETVLVDLDIKQGHIGLYLNQKTTNGLNELARLPEGMVAEGVPSQLTRYRKNLQLLLTENNLMGNDNEPSPIQIGEVMAALNHSGHNVVVDCARGLTAVNRPIIEQADEIIICLPPERAALSIAKQFLPKLQDSLFPSVRLHTVLVDFKGQVNIPQQAIEDFLGCPLAAIISVKPREINRAMNKNLPLIEAMPEAQAATTIRQLAQQIVKEQS